ITVHDLTGTDVSKVEIDLASTIGGTTGDAAVDVVSVDATNANNTITVSVDGSLVTVNGLKAKVTIDHAEVTDVLVIRGLDGNDKIDGSGLGTAMALQIDGGAGNDTIIGSAGNDMLLGGAGDDKFVWNPGNGNDVVDGQDGNDSLAFNGSNDSETISIGVDAA